MLVRTVNDVGLLVRDRRKRLGLSQLELAKTIGVSRQWVIELEHGKPTAEVALVLRALAALGLQIDMRDPRQESGTLPSQSYAAAVLAAAEKVLGHHRPAGTPLRTLNTKPGGWKQSSTGPDGTPPPPPSLGSKPGREP